MNVSTLTPPENPILPNQVVEEKEVYYPSTDENIMPEGLTHFLLCVQLISILTAYFANRNDVKVMGNLMFYYEEGNPKKVVSPDIMVCFGLNELPTRVYKLWEEHIVPSVIIEIASESTFDKDMTTKLGLYQRLGVEEYYIFDAERNCLREPLMAFRLIDFVYERVEVENGRVLSPALGLELVDTGETLRLYHPQAQIFLMSLEEATAELEEATAELEEATAEIEEAKAKAEEAKAENERLKAELAELKNKHGK